MRPSPIGGVDRLCGDPDPSLCGFDLNEVSTSTELIECNVHIPSSGTLLLSHSMMSGHQIPSVAGEGAMVGLRNLGDLASEGACVRSSDTYLG